MISIIIPVYNEDESLAILHGEIINVAQLHHLDVEILFVDDGSKDNSWDKICELSAAKLRLCLQGFRQQMGIFSSPWMQIFKMTRWKSQTS
jgi:glycosyltransferase involved in cell wall biosynthesis